MMLNCTTRLQVDRVLWRLFLLAPAAGTPSASANRIEGLESIERIIAPLGLHRKRANAFVKLSRDVQTQRAAHGGRIGNVSACHGVGVSRRRRARVDLRRRLAGPLAITRCAGTTPWAAERRENA